MQAYKTKMGQRTIIHIERTHMFGDKTPLESLTRENEHGSIDFNLSKDMSRKPT